VTLTLPLRSGGLIAVNGGPLGNPMLLIGAVVIFFLVFSMMMGRGRRREQKNYEQMLETLGKGMRVQTIGGIMGVITEVKDDIVTLKVDESNNTKIRMIRRAIRTVVPKEGESSEERK